MENVPFSLISQKWYQPLKELYQELYSFTANKDASINSTLLQLTKMLRSTCSWSVEMKDMWDIGMLGLVEILIIRNWKRLILCLNYCTPIERTLEWDGNSMVMGSLTFVHTMLSCEPKWDLFSMEKHLVKAWGKKLTNDNLIKKGITWVDWCCMSRCNGETGSFVASLCLAYALWSFVFCAFGVKWVMSKRVIL